VSSQGTLPFPTYAAELYQVWLDARLKTSAVGIFALARFQPSNALKDSQNDEYIFRISGDDPSHIPPLADVKEQVTSDWKLSHAYDLARDAARGFLADAQRRGLREASATLDPNPFLTTSTFSPGDLVGEQPSSATIQPLNLKPYSTQHLAQTALDLFSSPTIGSHRPVALAELYADANVAVVDLNSAVPMWSASNKDFYEQMAIMEFQREAERDFFQNYLNFDNIAARMKYKAAAPAATQD